MKYIKIYIIICLICPLFNYEYDNPPLEKETVKVEYICDCGYKDYLKWNDITIMQTKI